jgi:hypothetical protein
MPIVRWIPPDPGILDRVRTDGNGMTVWLDDDGLVSALRAAGSPSGLIRIGDEVRLTMAVETPPDRLRPQGRAG